MVPAQPTTETLSISTTSAVAAGYYNGDCVVVLPTVDCFVIAGTSAPTATTACMPLLAGNQYRLQLGGNPKLAFITSTGTGSVYITPGA